MSTNHHDDVGGPAQPLIIVENLKKHFKSKRALLSRTPPPAVRAVDSISFRIEKGETLGVVGESGCGKSTVARLLIRLLDPDEGEIIYDGQLVGGPRGISVRELRSKVQMVFQDSYASLNPRLPIEESVAFGPISDGVPPAEANARALSLLEKVGLDPRIFVHRYPHELSGGQRQRVNIARALALEPRLVILDEAVSALDKSVEAQVLNLLCDLKEQFGLTYLFISHDLNVVRYISDKVMVMYLGQIVEMGPVADVYAEPRHPYTKALLKSQPTMDPHNRTQQAPITGDPPNPISPPPGCRFHTRCPVAQPVCSRVEPRLRPVHSGAQSVACHLAESQSASVAIGA
jgi:peptide/nickel transport system ATP-binding protein